ncbi:class I SAM-dependent methyltransferase [bacterium]|nr:class I SAM-dependent methyltransferase [bacterium]
MNFQNAYEDSIRAEAYAGLEFSGCYYLAYRDLPDIIRRHVHGSRALDFGCGTGRPSRFLKHLGFEVAGVDIAKNMVSIAKKADPKGDYYVIRDGQLAGLEKESFDLVQAIFTFDNIPHVDRRMNLMNQLKSMLKPDGVILLLDATPEIYFHEWTFFSTRDFPENREKMSGEKVKIIITDTDDPRPVEDIIWCDSDYQDLFRRTGLRLIASYEPLGRRDEPIDWVNETEIAPWIIYVLRNSE